MTNISKPQKDEYADFYSSYIEQVGTQDVFELLSAQVSEIRNLAVEIGETKKNYSYGVGKWTIGELFGHLIDTERIFSYRAVHFARGDEQSVTGFNQELYVAEGNFERYTLDELVDQFVFLRQSNLLFIKHLSEAESLRCGVASGYDVSVRALVYMMAGHVIHHLKIIRDRYLNEF